jgi:tRNA nucleotidyltransferase/poly(A) polymerase
MKHHIPGKTYIVGGYVRDHLLQRPCDDIDYVVVGASPQAMLDAGFVQVGADFPVFLDPVNHNEYALARTERKSGNGYHGFTVHAAPDVTLEEDLSRRDFTINAMAMADDGSIIDPYHGQEDLKKGVLRHIGPAFREDPLRVLRAARLAARYNFTIAEETWNVMRTMCQEGEMRHIPAERVRAEFEKAMRYRGIDRMWSVAMTVNALEYFLPTALRSTTTGFVMNDIPIDRPPAHIWGWWLANTWKPAMPEIREMVQHMRLSSDVEYATHTFQALKDAQKNHTPSWDSTTLVKLWTQTDARRKNTEWLECLQTWCDIHAPKGKLQLEYQMDAWREMHLCLRNVSEREIAESIPKTPMFKTLLQQKLLSARVHALNDSGILQKYQISMAGFDGPSM